MGGIKLRVGLQFRLQTSLFMSTHRLKNNEYALVDALKHAITSLALWIIVMRMSRRRHIPDTTINDNI